MLLYEVNANNNFQLKMHDSGRWNPPREHQMHKAEIHIFLLINVLVLYGTTLLLYVVRSPKLSH